jgi:hypothetical protein
MTAPLPTIEGANKPFWEGLRRREVRVQHCGSCGLPRFPAARYCPRCQSEQSEWRAVAAKGHVETWCVFHQRYFEGIDVPYTVIQVRLDCGVRFFSNPAGIAAAALAIDLPVEAVFEDVTPEVTLLKFGPPGAIA